MSIYEDQINKQTLQDAFHATCERRETVFSESRIKEITELILNDAYMEALWIQFKSKNYYVGDLDWQNVIMKVVDFIEKYIVERDV